MRPTLIPNFATDEHTDIMAVANTNRFSTYTSVSGSGGSEGKNGEQKKDMWSSMLDSVASGKRLPEKNLLVMGMILQVSHHFKCVLTCS